jgi:hypothetical protein
MRLMVAQTHQSLGNLGVLNEALTRIAGACPVDAPYHTHEAKIVSFCPN